MKGMTKAKGIFASLVGVLDNVGVNWARTFSAATDGAPSVAGVVILGLG